MGQKSKNAGKKKHALPKVKVSCIQRDTFKISPTPEAKKALYDVIMASGSFDLKGRKCGHQIRNYSSSYQFKNSYQEL